MHRSGKPLLNPPDTSESYLSTVSVSAISNPAPYSTLVHEQHAEHSISVSHPVGSKARMKIIGSYQNKSKHQNLFGGSVIESMRTIASSKRTPRQHRLNGRRPRASCGCPRDEVVLASGRAGEGPRLMRLVSLLLIDQPTPPEGVYQGVIG